MKALVIGLVLVVLAAAGGTFYWLSKTPDKLNGGSADYIESPDGYVPNGIAIPGNQVIESNLVIGSDSGSQSVKKHGFYDFYSQDGWGYSTAEKRVLFFFASWCPTCKTAEEDFQANLSKLPENVAVFKVHYNDPQTFDEDKELAAKYGITYQHTFVQVDKGGNEITKWNGGGLDKLLTSIK